jgi:mono/diheme cytochrome c family protein
MRHPLIALLLHVLACLASGCARDADFDRMRRQDRPNPFEQSAAFGDGAMMRVPPAGTVPQETLDVSPPITAVLIAGGGHQFEIVCAVCHGQDASGGSIMSANISGTRPPPLVGGRVAALSDAELFNVITRGRNRMPGFGWSLPAAERWAVVAYVRTLQTAAPAETVKPR